MSSVTDGPPTGAPVVVESEGNSQAMVFVAGATSGMLLGMCTCVFLYLAFKYYQVRFPLGHVNETNSRGSDDMEMQNNMNNPSPNYDNPTNGYNGSVNGGYHTPAYQPPKITENSLMSHSGGSPSPTRSNNGTQWGRKTSLNPQYGNNGHHNVSPMISPAHQNGNMVSFAESTQNMSGHLNSTQLSMAAQQSGAQDMPMLSDHLNGSPHSHSPGYQQNNPMSFHSSQGINNGMGQVSFREEYPADAGVFRREASSDNNNTTTNTARLSQGPNELNQTYSSSAPLGGSFAKRGPSSSPRQSISRRRAATMFQGWRKARTLGAGMSGQVFLGVKSDGSLMAVKVLDINSIPGKKGIESLCNEIDILAKYSHENIVDYYGFHLDDDKKELHIFMEYVSNGSLGGLVRSMEQPLEQIAVAKYTAQILQGVAYLHANQIMHRDIKGDNILMHQDGAIKISDFGMSKSIGEALMNGGTQSYNCGGTPLWSAPEVFRGQTYDLKSDIWSVGCVVVELLTGRPPWQEFDTVWAAISTIGKCTSFPPKMPTAPAVSDECEDFLRCCLDIDCDKRSSAEELIGHEWIVNALEEDEDEDSMTSSISTHDDEAYKGQLFRKISQIHTPVASKDHSKQFPSKRPKGKLSSAAQLQYASMNLGDPQLPVNQSPEESPVMRPKQRWRGVSPTPSNSTTSSTL